MNRINKKELGKDVFFDIVAGLLIGIGLQVFAINGEFPVAGFSGIAIVLYHLFGLPVGMGTILLNIPVAILCFRFLGKTFFFQSVKTIVITSLIIDYVAPLLPAYNGNRLLAALCVGVFCGLGYAIIFTRGSSTGGQDFITVSIKQVKPHMTLGAITFLLDLLTIIIGYVVVFHDVDGLIYGIIVTYLMAVVMDKVLYGTSGGKMTLIVTTKGEEISREIDAYSGRGATILKGKGSFSGENKDVVMCACNNKQMYMIKKLAHKVDPAAFTIIMESNEVVGEGFSDSNKTLEL